MSISRILKEHAKPKPQDVEPYLESECYWRSTGFKITREFEFYWGKRASDSIVQLRRQSKMTRVKIAEKAGISKPELLSLENGKQPFLTMRPHLLIAIAKTFDCSCHRVITGVPPSEPCCPFFHYPDLCDAAEVFCTHCHPDIVKHCAGLHALAEFHRRPIATALEIRELTINQLSWMTYVDARILREIDENPHCIEKYKVGIPLKIAFALRCEIDDIIITPQKLADSSH